MSASVFFENAVWPIALVQDVIKWQICRANLGLEPKKVIFLGQKEN